MIQRFFQVMTQLCFKTTVHVRIGHPYSKECPHLSSYTLSTTSDRMFIYSCQLLFLISVSFNTGLHRHNKGAVTLQSGGWFKTPAGLRKTESQQLLRSQHLRPTTSKRNKCSLSVFMSVLLIDRKSIFKGIFLSPIHPRIYSIGVYDRP